MSQHVAIPRTRQTLLHKAICSPLYERETEREGDIGFMRFSLEIMRKQLADAEPTEHQTKCAYKRELIRTCADMFIENIINYRRAGEIETEWYVSNICD